MNRILSHCGAGVLFALVLLAPRGVLEAQQRYTLIGQVRDATLEAPITAAQVTVRGTSAVGMTDQQGAYRIHAVLRPGEYVVEAAHIGMAGPGQPVTLGADTIVQVPTILLRPSAVPLAEVVVTGTAAPTARRALGNAVSTVSGERLGEIPATTIDQALQGKVAGAVIVSNTGQPGGGVSMRLRGTSSIIGGAEPLYIVDGVIIDNNADQQINLGLRSNASNRLADLDPNDIERIEILKGAAAAALFGSRANNGVVQIFTRRGRVGETRIEAGTRVTHSSLERRIPFALTPVNLAGRDTTRFDHQDLIFNDAWSGDSFASISGGAGETRFFASANWVDQAGIMRGTDHRRLNFRANVDQRIGGWFDLGVGANYIRSWTDLQIQGEQGEGGLLTAITFTPTTLDLTVRDPITGVFLNRGALGNPLEVLEHWHTGQEISRFVGALSGRANPFTELTLEYRLGYDRYEMETFQSIPRGVSPPPLELGRAMSLNRRSTLLNNDLVGSYNLGAGDALRFTTSAGMNHTYQRVEQLNLTAQDIAPGTRLVRGAVQTSSEALIELVTIGFFAQEQVAWQERRFLTGALRLDASSTFGAQERWQLYPKVSGSWVLSEEPFWSEGVSIWLPDFRVRGALGFAGNQPPLAQAYATLPRFTQVLNINRLGLIPLATPANPDLRPERQREWELGVDAGLFGDRVGIGFTYYDQRTEDLLLPRPLSPSTGRSSILENVGVLRNRGIELELRTINIDRPDIGWSSNLVFSRNRNRVERLFIDPFTLGYTNRIEEGHPLGAHFMISFRRDEKGAIMRDEIGPLSAPARIVGDPWPDFTLSLNNDVRIGQNWSARVLLDGSFGHELWNQTRRIMDIFEAGPLYDQLLRGEITPAQRTRLQGIWENYLEDATYVKLRDVAIRYNTSAPWLRAVGASGASFEIVGRNLVTWTDYTGYDPEINMFGQNTVERGTDFAVYPNPRTIGFGVRLHF
jgi:TonB-dependent starch-binding outer membrane protein SusC